MGKTIYSFESRLDAVQRCLTGTPLHDVAEELDCSVGDIQKWRDAYIEHGPDGVRPRVYNARYSSDFKVSVIEYMYSTGSSIRKTAAHFNIPSIASVIKWEKQYKENGVDAFRIEKRGRGRPVKKRENTSESNESNANLLKEIKRLKMENEYLKN